MNVAHCGSDFLARYALNERNTVTINFKILLKLIVLRNFALLLQILVIFKKKDS